jgi:hypothetical protein
MTRSHVSRFVFLLSIVAAAAGDRLYINNTRALAGGVGRIDIRCSVLADDAN